MKTRCKYSMPVIDNTSGKSLRLCTKTNTPCKEQKEKDFGKCKEREERR